MEHPHWGTRWPGALIFVNKPNVTESNETLPEGTWDHLGRPWKRVLDFELMLECYSTPKLAPFQVLEKIRQKH